MGLFLAFRRHIECRATSEVVRDGILGGQTEVSKLYGTVTGEQHVLRFEIAVVDPHIMAILNGLAHLNEGPLDECVIILV